MASCETDSVQYLLLSNGTGGGIISLFFFLYLLQLARTVVSQFCLPKRCDIRVGWGYTDKKQQQQQHVNKVVHHA